MGFVFRPLSDLAEMDCLDRGVVLRGLSAFNRGQPLDQSMGDLWCWGWHIGADQRRQKAEAALCL